MNDYLHSLLLSPLDPVLALVQPDQRVFWVFMVSSVVLALWALRREGVVQAIKKIVAPAIWWHRSARADYRLIFVKAPLRAALLAPFIVSSAVIAAAVSVLLILSLGERPALPWSVGALAGFTLVAFVFEDFMRYLLHRAMHRVPVLWELHKVHHSAEVLTPFTLFRTHPVESFLNSTTSAMAIGLVTGVFFYVFGAQLEAYKILGIDALGFVFSLLGANLRHSHIWLSWGPLERYFISPAQHQLHHSQAPEHHDKNYGVFFAVWDRVAGSLLLSGEPKILQFGLPAESRNHSDRVGSMLIDPVRAAWAVWRASKRTRRGRQAPAISD